MSQDDISSMSLLPHASTKVGFAAGMLRRLLSRIDRGRLTVQTPDGRSIAVSGSNAGPEAILILENWRPLRLLLARGDVGFAESYMDGDWRSPDLPALLELAAVNIFAIDNHLKGFAPMRLLRRVAHLAHANTRKGSRRNIAFHYDLGNEFYAQWLDRQMIYSSGIYDGPASSLEEAQKRKVDRIIELLDLSPGQKVLEIGCGWGALAARTAQAGTDVTAITLSAEQLAYAERVVGCKGLRNKVELALRDYRDIQEKFDRIVSVEMIEAVGEAYWRNYFKTLRRSLVPGGKAVLQAITIHEDRFEVYRSGADFIQTYIFPGGMLPTKTIIEEQATEAGLQLSASEHFGQSYALTLRDWRQRFLHQWPRIEALGFSERFRRLWEYYFCYCEAGFRAGTIDVGLYVLRG